MRQHSQVVAEVASALAAGQVAKAKGVLEAEYAFRPDQSQRPRFKPARSLPVFLRDGFIDRYGGERLVFPGALHLISCLLPNAFPYHPHGHMQHCHMAFWQLFPSVDHIVPVARGGSNDMENLVCTSMLRNQVKSGWLLSELGWELQPPRQDEEWDGLVGWFLEVLPKHREFLSQRPALRQWEAAIRNAGGVP